MRSGLAVVLLVMLGPAGAAPSQRQIAEPVGGRASRRAIKSQTLNPQSSIAFSIDVMSVLSKAGCNQGVCHGNQNGKGGFKLSLRGEDREWDYDALTRDAFGRRVNLLEPEKSLILLKPTMQVAHEGGKRFARGSPEYRILLAWLSAGTPKDPTNTPRLTGLKVSPTDKIIYVGATLGGRPEKGRHTGLPLQSHVQLRAVARFSDGSTRDVTRLAMYDAATDVVTVNPSGLVQGNKIGETTILVRYLDRQAPVRLAFVPLPRQPVKIIRRRRSDPPDYTIDHHIFAKLEKLGIKPAPLCSDMEFVRRAYLDLLGRIPTAEEARAFMQIGNRGRLVDELLKNPDFADFWAIKWADLLKLEEKALDRKGVQAFHRWIRQSILENKPLDQFVRELITARGSTYEVPPTNFYRANRTPIARGEAAAQVFLGVRLQCAQCHNHPFDRWKQQDYYDWMANFARIDYKILENKRRDGLDKHEFIGEQIVYLASEGEVKNPRTGKAAKPRVLVHLSPVPFPKREGEREQFPSPIRRGDRGEVDELNALAFWLTSPRNPYFAKSQVNRIWYYLIGRGLVDPIDDFRATNPPSHPELLDALASDFVKHNFDMRHVIRMIMNSMAYQLASDPDPGPTHDRNRNLNHNRTRARQRPIMIKIKSRITIRDEALLALAEANYAFVPPRRLTAEQLIDSLHLALDVPTRFNGYPAGMRAAQVPGVLAVRVREQKPSASDMMLKLFGKPMRLLACECERNNDATMNQAFAMISGAEINAMLTDPNNRLTRILHENQPANQPTNQPAQRMVVELYWTTLSRRPTPKELQAASRHLENSKDKRAGLEDITWALVNSKEFLLRK